MLQVARETNANTLTAHPNPIEASNFRKMIGYKTPPKLLPVAATPVAKPRFVEKYWYDAHRGHEDTTST